MTDESKSTSPPKRDFAAVVRRARSIDPDRIPEQMVDEADQRDPAPGAEPPPASDLDPKLQVFIGAAQRSLLEAPSPAKRRTKPSGPPIWAVGAAVLALAGAVALGWNGYAAIWKPASEVGTQAGYVAPTRERGTARERSGMDTASAPVPAPGSAPETPPAGDVAPVEAVEPVPPSSRSPDPVETEARAQRDPDESTKRARLAKLDTDAQAAWKEGRLAEAERLFRQIVTVAPKSSQAELAYGDLLALAHQRKDAAAEIGLRREYLRRFPKGRFADDVRAASCRAQKAEASGCWREYLDAHPGGAYRREAQRFLDGSTPTD